MARVPEQPPDAPNGHAGGPWGRLYFVGFASAPSNAPQLRLCPPGPVTPGPTKRPLTSPRADPSATACEAALGRTRPFCGKEPGGKLKACAVALGLLASGVASAEAEPLIRIGASASQTGQYALLGQNHLRGYQLCIKQTNEKGGVLGRKLALLVEDDHSEPAMAVRIY